jgi:hypothetical protein
VYQTLKIDRGKRMMDCIIFMTKGESDTKAYLTGGHILRWRNSKAEACRFTEADAKEWVAAYYNSLPLNHDPSIICDYIKIELEKDNGGSDDKSQAS